MAAPSCFGQLGLGLAPMRTELRLTPGSQHSGVLALVNDSDTKVRVSAEFLDFFIDSSTGPQFSRSIASEAEYSCRRWLNLNPMQFELNAGEQISVRYTLRAPAQVLPRSYHCAAGFATQPTADKLSATGLRTGVRVISAFYAVIGDLPASGELKALRLESVAANRRKWQAVAVIENHGLTFFRPRGELELIAADGNIVERAEFVPMPALPRREQNYVFALQTATPGRYRLRAKVELAGEVQEGATDVVIESPANESQGAVVADSAAAAAMPPVAR
jgi:hypothetical protein